MIFDVIQIIKMRPGRSGDSSVIRKEYIYCVCRAESFLAEQELCGRKTSCHVNNSTCYNVGFGMSSMQSLIFFQSGNI